MKKWMYVFGTPHPEDEEIFFKYKKNGIFHTEHYGWESYWCEKRPFKKDAPFHDEQLFKDIKSEEELRKRYEEVQVLDRGQRKQTTPGT